MCPHDILQVKGYALEDFYGDEWERRYRDCVADPRISKRRILIKDLVRLILKSAVETGTPFAFMRDTVNRANPNGHEGVIYCSNLWHRDRAEYKRDRGGDARGCDRGRRYSRGDHHAPRRFRGVQSCEPLAWTSSRRGRRNHGPRDRDRGPRARQCYRPEFLRAALCAHYQPSLSLDRSGRFGLPPHACPSRDLVGERRSPGFCRRGV